MSTKWTHTREALLQLQPGDAGKYLTRLVFKGPQIIARARELMEAYPLTDDRFKIHMIHYLRQTLPAAARARSAVGPWPAPGCGAGRSSQSPASA